MEHRGSGEDEPADRGVVDPGVAAEFPGLYLRWLEVAEMAEALARA